MTGLFIASGLISLLSRLSYKSSLSGVHKFALGLILFSVAASPLLGALSDISNISLPIIPPNTEESDGGIGLYETAFADGIASAVSEKFELRRADVRVITEGFAAGEWRAEKIRIILSGGAVLADYHKIEKFIGELEIGECEVELEIV